MALKIVKAVDWNHVEWDCVPTPGEVYVLVRPEAGAKYLKVGDGVRSLDVLPYLQTGSLEDYIEEETIRETCAQCDHLCIINRNKVYAVCDETGKVFELWTMDTRESDACKKFKHKRRVPIQ